MEIVDLYARLSDDKGGTSSSVENQIARMRAYADEQGWQVGQVYRDDSISATKGVNRPQFKALLNREHKRPVLVFAWDRLVRVIRDLVLVLDQDLKVYFVEDAPFDLSTEDGQFMATIYTGMATKEIKTRTKRQKLASDARAADGLPYWRVAPFGHTLEGALVEDEADLIRTAVAGLLDGTASLSGIAREWNAAGVRTSKSASVWRQNTVRDMVTNSRMVGDLVYKGSLMTKSVIEPILSREDYDALRALVSDPKRRSGSKAGGPVANLGSGIYRCGICNDGSTVHATNGQDRFGRRFEVYKCSSKSHCRHYRAETDGIVTSEIFALIYNDPSIIQTQEVDRSAAAEVARLTDEIGEMEASVDSGDLDFATFQRISKSRRKALTEARERMNAGQVTDLFRGLEMPDSADLHGVAETINDVLAPWWDGLSLERKRALVFELLTVTLLPRTNKSFKDDDQYVDVEPKGKGLSVVDA